MTKKHMEARVEDAIEHCLLNRHGYRKGESSNYDVSLGLEPARLISFIKNKQLKTWSSLDAIHGSATEKIVLNFLTMGRHGGFSRIRRINFKDRAKQTTAARNTIFAIH
jgi:hypothetical protein